MGSRWTLEMDDVITCPCWNQTWWRHKMEHFSRYWPVVRGIHWRTVDFPAIDAELWFFSLICIWMNGWANNRDACDLIRNCAHYDIIVMKLNSVRCWYYWNTDTESTMIIMTSSNGNIFRVTGPFCGEFTGHRWIPLTKASDAELWCFLLSATD